MRLPCIGQWMTSSWTNETIEWYMVNINFISSTKGEKKENFNFVCGVNWELRIFFHEYEVWTNEGVYYHAFIPWHTVCALCFVIHRFNTHIKSCVFVQAFGANVCVWAWYPCFGLRALRSLYEIIYFILNHCTVSSELFIVSPLCLHFRSIHEM